MFDYEYATVSHHLNVRLVDEIVVPEAIPLGRLAPYGAKPSKVFRYPGLKEEYYLYDFQPDTTMLEQLGIDTRRDRRRASSGAERDAVPSPREPPVRAGRRRPRRQTQRDPGRSSRAPTSSAEHYSSLGLANVVVPEKAIDGLSLIAAADFVIGAGGTMNREAVALGTPAYTMFAGRLGAVDERLIAENRLGRAASADDVTLKKKSRHTVQAERRDPQLFVDEILAVARRRLARASRSRCYDWLPAARAQRAARRSVRRGRPRPGDTVRERLFVSRHRIWQIVIDAALVSLAFICRYLLRFDFDDPARVRPSAPLGDRAGRRRQPGCSFHALRPVQQVVALFGRARPRRPFWRRSPPWPWAWSSPSTWPTRCSPPIYGRWHNDITAHRLPWSVLALDWLLVLRPDGRRAAAGPHLCRRALARELGRDRKRCWWWRRRRRRARRARDARHAPASATGPSASSTTTRKRRTCASTACAWSAPPATCPR